LGLYDDIARHRADDGNGSIHVDIHRDTAYKLTRTAENAEGNSTRCRIAIGVHQVYLHHVLRYAIGCGRTLNDGKKTLRRIRRTRHELHGHGIATAAIADIAAVGLLRLYHYISHHIAHQRNGSIHVDIHRGIPYELTGAAENAEGNSTRGGIAIGIHQVHLYDILP